MNLGQLKVLVAIVETGSLTEAADVVGLTQSAVSHSLNKLEAELGVTLLERGRQGVATTQIGEEVLAHARSVLAQVEIIRQKTGRARGVAVGKLRFGCVRNVAGRLVTGIMRDFQQKYPDIDLVLFEGTSQELIGWLEAGVIDVGTILLPEGYLTSVPLVKSEIKVIVPAGHPFVMQTAVTIEALAAEALIGPKTEYAAFRGLLKDQQLSIPRLHHEVSTLATIFAMIREHMGVAIMPEMLVDPVAEGLASISLQPRLFLNVHMATNSQSPAVEAFLASAHRWTKEHGFLPDNT